MTSSEFKKPITRALQAIGFVYGAGKFERQAPEVLALLAFQKGHGQWFINVGFWLHALGAQPPSRIEAAHLYFRLDRLLPDLREHILWAGGMNEPGQQAAHDKLLDWIPTRVNEVLTRLQSVSALAEAFRKGELKYGLVRGEARRFLGQFEVKQVQRVLGG